MSNFELMVALAALIDWEVPAHLMGTAALLRCAGKALRKERSGERWTALGCCMEVAQEQGETQRNLWECMVRALQQSHGPQTPAAALREIVAMGKEVGQNAAGDQV